jgi:outer membrane protein assembly factor BamD
VVFIAGERDLCRFLIYRSLYLFYRLEVTIIPGQGPVGIATEETDAFTNPAFTLRASGNAACHTSNSPKLLLTMKFSLLFTSRCLRIMTAVALLSLLLVTLPGCSSTGNFFETTVPEDMNLNFPAETLIRMGMDDYNRGKYFVAIEYFNKVLDNYRFSPQAPLAQLKVADCNYYLEKYIEAYMHYQKFEEMHPTNEAIPYVMYQKAMCHYKNIDTVDRDVTGAMKAIEHFQLLLKAYPDSPYTEDAKAKILASQEFLASHELIVARFFIRTGKDSQAVGRLKYILAMYPQTSIASQASGLIQEIGSH